MHSFNAPNVELVATGRAGVERITSGGAVVDGIEHPLDCLVFVTGFDTASSFAKRSGGMAVRGIGAATLTDNWGGDPSTLHGIHIRCFPNAFFIGQSQAGMSPNFPHMLGGQALHVVHIVRHCLSKGVRTVEPTEAAEADWVETIVRGAAARRRLLEDCTIGYYINESRPLAAAARGATYAPGPIEFARLLRTWRERGNLAGLELESDHAGVAADVEAGR